jgi:acyl carrier protein
MSDQKEIQEKLSAKLVQLLPQQKDKLSIDVPLHTLGVDSMRLVELFIFIEMEFGIDLMNSGIEMKNIQTVKSMSEFIALKRGPS